MSTFINSFWKTAVSFITMSSTSVSASWSPRTITNTSTTLDWTVSNGVTIAKTTINDPTFDFSGNSGTADILVENTGGLTHLACNDNSLTALDVSKGTALTYLDCGGNSLTALNVSTNTALTELECYYNSLTALDVSTNTALTYLDCGGNSLTALNVSTNTALTYLACNDNSLTALDVSTNTVLIYLVCTDNPLTALVTDQIFIDLDTNGVIGGTLFIRNNRTSASDTAIANLITKDWTITEQEF